jgi:hypothetical protein
MPTDGSGQHYVDLPTVRVTFVPRASRSPQADWSGTDVIRVQAYKGPGDYSLHMGAEVPIASAEDFADFVATLCSAYADGRRLSKVPSQVP